MKIDTKLTRLLGIKYPIIQGGMVWTSGAELASSVSNAGGLGVLGAGKLTSFGMLFGGPLAPL